MRSSENWYFNQIQGPNTLAKILLLLQHGNRLPAATLKEADIDVRRGADWWRGWSGMNLVDLATLQIYRGLLYHDESLVDEGFNAVWGQLKLMPWPPPTPSQTAGARCNSSAVATTPCIPHSCQVGGGSYLGDGIQRDGSFHQHGAELLSGAYGEALTSSILGFLPIGKGLKWDVDASSLAVFARLVLDGQQRMTLPNRVWDWQVCGRGCHCRPGVATNGLHGSQLRYAASLYPEGEHKRRFLAFANEQDGQTPEAIDSSVLGSFAYFRSDYLLHRREGWAASWKGRSNRTIPSRCVNNDDKMGADTGEGATFVYRTDVK